MENTMDKNFNNDEYIYLSLLHLGAVTWNKSSKRLLLALQYAVSDKSIMENSVKHLYDQLAFLQKCTYGVIERSLRYAIRQLWECSKSECSKLLYHSTVTLHCPSVSEFIFLYASAFQRGIIQDWVDGLETQSKSPIRTDIMDILEMF